MIIRSQDKKTIANIDCIDTITIIGEEIRYFYGAENSFGILGYYSTEEKAVKVLNMIQNAYCKCESVKTLTTGTNSEIARYIAPQERMDMYVANHRSQFVFQMPQDSEV